MPLFSRNFGWNVPGESVPDSVPDSLYEGYSETRSEPIDLIAELISCRDIQSSSSVQAKTKIFLSETQPLQTQEIHELLHDDTRINNESFDPLFVSDENSLNETLPPTRFYENPEGSQVNFSSSYLNCYNNSYSYDSCFKKISSKNLFTSCPSSGDIGHPTDFHHFKNIQQILQKENSVGKIFKKDHGKLFEKHKIFCGETCNSLKKSLDNNTDLDDSDIHSVSKIIAKKMKQSRLQESNRKRISSLKNLYSARDQCRQRKIDDWLLSKNSEDAKNSSRLVPFSNIAEGPKQLAKKLHHIKKSEPFLKPLETNLSNIPAQKAKYHFNSSGVNRFPANEGKENVEINAGKYRAEESLDSNLKKILKSPTVHLYESERNKRIESLVGKIVRKKSERQFLKGYECKCCEHYYDALKLDAESRMERINQVFPV